MSQDQTSPPREEYTLRSVEALREHYRPPTEGVVLKTIDVLDDYCRAFISASPFVVLATGASSGLDCSPKGDAPGFIQVADEKTLLIPDRPGNNRIDGLSNIVQDPRVGIIFLIPGLEESLRVNGLASISIDPEWLKRLKDAKGRTPKSVIAVHVQEVFVHCGRALEFAQLWDVESWPAQQSLPDIEATFKAHLQYSRQQRSGVD